MEALGEPSRFLVLASEEQFARFVWLDFAYVLNVNLVQTKEFIIVVSEKYMCAHTWADFNANFTSTSLHRAPSHKKMCSPLSRIIMSSSAKSSWQKSVHFSATVK